ncbi:hypothetical protein DFH06DRAFT_1191955 [Mycena polygramma]|nr:hypothetical protein DFH06DRAFT_1191955 [Mycena polygramma]
MGVLSFGVCRSRPSSSSPSPPPTFPTRTASRFHAQTQKDDGLSRTFLEELEATWAVDPEHHFLTIIDEEWDEGDGVRVWATQDREHETDAGKSKTILHTPQNRVTTRASSTQGRGVERDTISSGLKRTERVQVVSAAVGPGVGARKGVWRV